MVNVAVIGRGFMGNTHLEALSKLDNVNIVAIAARNEEKGKKLAAQYSCDYYQSAEEMIKREDIDIVDICTPTYLHEPFTIMAAQAGKHVFCEKPFTLSVESADRMIEACEKSGVKLMVGQTLRFWPEYVKIKELFDRGELGDVHTIYASRLGQTPNWGDWFQDPNKSGGALYDMHIHDIDYLRYLLGPVKSVYASGKQSETGCYDHVMTHLVFENGTKAVVEGSNIMTDDFPFTMSLRAVGNSATLDFHFSAGHNLENIAAAQSYFNRYKKGEKPQMVEVPEGDPYLEELRYFIECVEKDETPQIVTIADSREVLVIMEAIQKALATNEVHHLS